MAIEVEVGQEFAVTLESNPTTGYRWRLAEPLDSAALELVNSEFERPETDLVGAGGEEVWTFRAKRRGETVVRLEYAQPWERDVPPAESRVLTVFVR